MLKVLKKKMEIEDLAVMVKHGFDAVDKRFEAVDKRFEAVDNKLSEMSQKIRSIERDVAHIHDHMVYQDSFEDLSARVKYMELKLGIDSGK
jgi:predicted nuclease with TOPRIM domain